MGLFINDVLKWNFTALFIYLFQIIYISTFRTEKDDSRYLIILCLAIYNICKNSPQLNAGLTVIHFLESENYA
jgi:hypothetical protein